MKHAAFVAALLVACAAPASAATAEKAGSVREADRNGDGKIDHWTWLDDKGAAKRVGMDTNGDGAVDRAQLMIEKRIVILKENDRNFDGKVDDRNLAQRQLDRQGLLRHVWVWRELDDDYDGVVDKFMKREGVRRADTTGKPIGQEFTLEKPKPAPAGAASGKTERSDLEQREHRERMIEESRKRTESMKP